MSRATIKVENQLGAILDKQGMSHYALHQKTGICKNQLRKIAEDSGNLHLSTAFIIAEALGVSVAAIWPDVKRKAAR